MQTILRDRCAFLSPLDWRQCAAAANVPIRCRLEPTSHDLVSSCCPPGRAHLRGEEDQRKAQRRITAPRLVYTVRRIIRARAMRMHAPMKPAIRYPSHPPSMTPKNERIK